MIKKLFLTIICCLALTACGAEANEERAVMSARQNTVSDIEGQIVYIKENGRMVPFIVADVQYQKGTAALLRRDVLPELMRFNEYDSYYENSEIDKYLSETYRNELEDIGDYLSFANITITAEEAIGLSGKETRNIERCIFLPSYTELGFKESPTTTNEGGAFSYFKKGNDRVAMADNSSDPETYYMRSPNTYHTSAVYYFAYDGTIGFGSASDPSGIRPVVCVDNSAPVEEYADADEAAFVIK